MNVDDFKHIEIPGGDRLSIIFDHQRQLMEKYHSIEEANVGHSIPSAPYKEFLYAGALDLQDRASQLRCKSFAWRITEEITEATLCLIPGEVDTTHYLEELADALHFSVELLCLSGVNEENFAEMPGKDRLELLFAFSDASILPWRDAHSQNEIRLIAYHAVEALGEACNRLKMKEWKTTPMLTDVDAYRLSIEKFFEKLIDLMKTSGFTADTLTQFYLRKAAVNRFRQGSAY